MKICFERLVRSIWSFWFLIVTLAFTALFVALYVYRQNFGGVFSPLASDWSAFGGYMGGVLGPLVSFLTLLAVLKTVYLQRELLDAQKAEFSRMYDLQAKTFESQNEQLKLAEADSRVSRVQSYQATQIKLIEMLIDQQLKLVSEIGGEIIRVRNSDNLLNLKADGLRRMEGSRSLVQKKADSLVGIALEVSIGEFKDIDEIKTLVRPKLKEILGADSIP